MGLQCVTVLYNRKSVNEMSISIQGSYLVLVFYFLFFFQKIFLKINSIKGCLLTVMVDSLSL